MTPTDAWTLKLWMAAPTAPWLVVRPLAVTLVHGNPEVLLKICDTLEEGAREARAYGCEWEASAALKLAALVREEAARLAPPTPWDGDRAAPSMADAS